MSHLPPGRSLKQSPFHLLLNSLLSLIGEKIWIQCDDTKEDVATDLLEAGLPKEDIVLGFRQPFPTTLHLELRERVFIRRYRTFRRD